MRLGKKRRERPDGTVFWDVMLALAVLLGVGLLFWTYFLFSTVPGTPHYPDEGLGAFRAYWTENTDRVDQPLTMFTVALSALSVYLIVLFITIRRKRRPRRLPERTAIGAAFILIAVLFALTDGIADLALTGRLRPKIWWPATLILSEPSFELYPIDSVYLYGDPEARFWARIGEGWVFLPDADTVHIGQHDYRLWGIDALQTEQSCLRDGKIHYRLELLQEKNCGWQARHAFLELMSSAPVSCYLPDQARYPYTISCRAGGRDVAESMVRRGYAFPTEAGRHRYDEALRESMAQKAGAWGTTFLHPRKWRDARCERIDGLCQKIYGHD